MFATHDPLGNPVDRRHPWNQHTIPAPQKRDFDDKYCWTMSPRWFDGKDHLALDTGGGPLARLWATALAGLVDIGFVKATGHSVQINLPRTILKPEVSFEWKTPVDKQGTPLSNAIERNRARTYFQAYAAGCALHFIEKALAEVRGGQHQDLGEVRRARTRRSASASPRRSAACSATTWSSAAARSRTTTRTRRRRGTAACATATARPARTRTPCRTPRSSRRAATTNFKGIDIMRAVRSFDPCLPCGVHMYKGDGKPLHMMHVARHAQHRSDVASTDLDAAGLAERIEELLDGIDGRRRTRPSGTPPRSWCGC